MASNSPGYGYACHLDDRMPSHLSPHLSDSGESLLKDSGYYVTTSDGASTCSSSTTEASTGEGEGAGAGGTLLVLEPKSLRSFTTNDEYLYAMKEDLADWFTCLYKHELAAETFFSVLETGVLLCQHANKVQEFARQRRQAGEALEMKSYFIRSVPESSVQYKEGVRPETFQARDNVSNFISWSRSLGIPDVLSFETDDLVLRKNEKSVILCLLEIARVGAKLGMLAPTLVQMEQEIDAELAGEEPKPQVQIKTCDMRSLDERVRDLIGRCTCPIQFPMQKVGEGKYKIGDSRSLIFVRILRNHVMVRVGGGWDTLENYLNKHDPCQCNYRGHRAGSAQPGVTHKVTTSQRRASMPGQTLTSRPPSATPTSPRRVSTVAPPTHTPPTHAPHARSTSPSSGRNHRSKSPSLIISRHNVNKPSSKTSQLHSGGGASGGGGANSSTSSDTPTRSVSPGPGRLRSPSPVGTPNRPAAQSPAPTGIPTRPSVLRTSSSSALLKGQEIKAKRGDKGAFHSDVGDDEEDEEDDEVDWPQSWRPALTDDGQKKATRTSKIPTIIITPSLREKQQQKPTRVATITTITTTHSSSSMHGQQGDRNKHS